MATDGWRFDVIVNPDLLVAHVESKKVIYRELGARVGCSHSAIGHYRAGFHKRCNTNRAHKVAKVLDAPLSPLFLPEVSRVTREGRRKAIA